MVYTAIYRQGVATCESCKPENKAVPTEGIRVRIRGCFWPPPEKKPTTRSRGNYSPTQAKSKTNFRLFDTKFSFTIYQPFQGTQISTTTVSSPVLESVI